MKQIIGGARSLRRQENGLREAGLSVEDVTPSDEDAQPVETAEASDVDAQPVEDMELSDVTESVNDEETSDDKNFSDGAESL